MLRRISLAEEFEDTTGVSPWSFIIEGKLIGLGKGIFFADSNIGLQN